MSKKSLDALIREKKSVRYNRGDFFSRLSQQDQDELLESVRKYHAGAYGPEQSLRAFWEAAIERYGISVKQCWFSRWVNTIGKFLAQEPGRCNQRKGQ